MTALDAFGRRCLAWPAMFAAIFLTWVGKVLLQFAAWILDFNPDEWQGEDED